MHDTTTTMATADTPPDHVCPCLHETDCEDAARVAEETAPMKLTDQRPKWITAADGREGLGITFDCPCNTCGGALPDERQRIHIFFDPPLDGLPQIADAARTWQRTGTTFDDLTLSPSIRFSATRPPGDQLVEHWHGYVRAGHVTS